MVVWAFLGFNAGALLEYNYSETAVVISRSTRILRPVRLQLLIRNPTPKILNHVPKSSLVRGEP